MTSFPAPHWNPSFFSRGDKVMYGEFPATVICHYYEGMWTVLVPGGPICVTGADLKRVA